MIRRALSIVVETLANWEIFVDKMQSVKHPPIDLCADALRDGVVYLQHNVFNVRRGFRSFR